MFRGIKGALPCRVRAGLGPHAAYSKAEYEFIKSISISAGYVCLTVVWEGSPRGVYLKVLVGYLSS